MKRTEEERLSFAKGLVATAEYADDINMSYRTTDPSARIGKDGFGWVRQEDGTLYKMPHTGRVRIKWDVTIGAQTCIDRAVIGETVILEGTQIDNLVHVAHGAKVGRHCLIVAGAVLGGSCEIGDFTFIGMNACIKNKIKIGSNCIIGAGAVVLKDVPDGEVWVGNPAKFLKMNDKQYTINN